MGPTACRVQCAPLLTLISVGRPSPCYSALPLSSPCPFIPAFQRPSRYHSALLLSSLSPGIPPPSSPVLSANSPPTPCPSSRPPAPPTPRFPFPISPPLLPLPPLLPTALLSLSPIPDALRPSPLLRLFPGYRGHSYIPFVPLPLSPSSLILPFATLPLPHPPLHPRHAAPQSLFLC